MEVKLAPSPDGAETFILARSAERREKEKAIHERFVRRMEEGLQQLQAAMRSGRLHDESTAHRRLGRLQGKNSRAAKAFDVQIERVAEETTDAVNNKKRKKSKNKTEKTPRLQITWQRNEQWAEWARLSEGCYLPRSNLNEMTRMRKRCGSITSS